MITIHDFQKYKVKQQKLTMITCYDYTFASIINQSDIDIILVGDSAAMVMHGHQSTVMATVDMMVTHTQAVARGAVDKWIVGDMPFLSYRCGLTEAMTAVMKLMQAGAHMIKLEGIVGNETLIEHCVASGIPVMGHLGLTPQMIHQLGGFRVQGRDGEAAKQLMQQARQMDALGVGALVLECVPSEVAAMISRQLKIPVIGIGAGPDVDGQVLVLQDLLGLNPNFKPKFLKTYLEGYHLIAQALTSFVDEVKGGVFPEKAQSYD